MPRRHSLGRRRSWTLCGCLSRRAAIADRHVVFLGLAWRAPAVTLESLQQFLQRAHDFGPLRELIAAFGEVLAQVKELTGLVVARVTALLLKPPRFTTDVVLPGGSVDEHPFPLANGELAGSRVVDGGFAQGPLERLAEEDRHQVDAVLARVRRHCRADQRRHGGHEVHVTDGLVAHGTGLDRSRPAREERDAMPAFPGVALRAAQATHAVVPELSRAVVNSGLDFAGDLRAVVAREEDECILRDARPL